ncbi:nuclear transport factor 2 family protein [Halorubrum gandharaense]
MSDESSVAEDSAGDATSREAAVREYYDAIDGGNYDRLAALLRPTFTHHRPDRTIEGRERFVRFMREERPMTETEHVVDAVYPKGVGVAARGRLLDADGEVLFGYVDVFTFEEDAIAGLETYTDG